MQQSVNRWQLVSTATDTQTREELLETEFSIGSTPRLYREHKLDKKNLQISSIQCIWLQQMTDPSSHQRGCPTLTKLQLSDSNKYLVLDPRWGLTPRLIGQLTVSCNVTLTWTKIWSWAPDGAWLQEWLANWPSVIIVPSTLTWTYSFENVRELWRSHKSVRTGAVEHRSWGICIVGCRCQATTSEDKLGRLSMCYSEL
jgi:hypothetical protein